MTDGMSESHEHTLHRHASTIFPVLQAPQQGKLKDASILHTNCSMISSHCIAVVRPKEDEPKVIRLCVSISCNHLRLKFVQQPEKYIQVAGSLPGIVTRRVESSDERAFELQHSAQ